MSDIRDKIKRQIEILGIAIENPEKYKIVDLEVMFNCNEATIKRDLKDLRVLGIEIHSVSRRGLRVESNIDPKVLNDLINDYILLNNSSINIEKSTHFLVNSRKEAALSTVTMIQYCIDKNLIAKILYKKQNRKNTELREVAPLIIFYGKNEYRLFAAEDKTYKQFLLSRIQSVEITNKKFKPVSKNKIDSVFATSLDFWLGEKTIKIKLLLLKPWYSRRKLPLLVENQTIIKNSDGSLGLEAEVNSIAEVAQWVVTQGRGIKVIEPLELINLVLNLAKGVVRNYKSDS